jgi:hypothetical protein
MDDFQKIFSTRVLRDEDADNWYVDMLKWCKNHHTLPKRLSYVDHNNIEMWKDMAEYWKAAYVDFLFKRGTYVNHLKTLNEDLRERLALLQRHIDEVSRTKEISIVGNTTYITYKKGLETSKWIE